MFINKTTAEEIVKLNEIECCYLCKNYKEYGTDLDFNWFCTMRTGFELAQFPWIYVFKKTDCIAYFSKEEK